MILSVRVIVWYEGWHGPHPSPRPLQPPRFTARNPPAGYTWRARQPPSRSYHARIFFWNLHHLVFSGLEFGSEPESKRENPSSNRYLEEYGRLKYCSREAWQNFIERKILKGKLIDATFDSRKDSRQLIIILIGL